VEVDLSRVRVEDTRSFGGEWLALQVVKKLGLRPAGSFDAHVVGRTCPGRSCRWLSEFSSNAGHDSSLKSIYLIKLTDIKSTPG
jgi:hypothetical protein